MTSVHYDIYIQPGFGERGSAYRLHADSSVYESIVLTKDTIKQRLIAKDIDLLCKDTVSASYVKSAVDTSTLIVLLYVNRGLSGFVLANETEHGGIYLDVICAVQRGGELLRVFLMLAEKYGAKYVMLSALASVLSFYPQYGFQHRMDCDMGKGPDVVMPPELIQWIKTTRPTEEQLLEHPVFSAYLNYLREMGYSVNTDDECKNTSKNMKNYIEDECHMSGFEMRKCFVHDPQITRTVHTRAMTRRKKAKQAKQNAFSKTLKNMHTQ
jgi:hypothetical protein